MECFISINGSLLPERRALLPALDRGFLYGYGLFETILVKDGQAVYLQEHLARLERSAPQISLPLPEETVLAAWIREVIDRNELDLGSLRLTVSPGIEGAEKPTVVITAKKGLAYREEHYARGFKAGFLSTHRNEHSRLVYVKCLNYLENILGRREALGRGWNEGLFLNTRGLLAEGTVSNIFLVTAEGEVVTPEVKSGLLPGVMRAKVLEKASAAGYRCTERAVQPEELFTARECFLTNSLMGVMPLTAVEGKPIGDGGPGELTGKIILSFDRPL